jgi:hypothetical protein
MEFDWILEQEFRASGSVHTRRRLLMDWHPLLLPGTYSTLHAVMMYRYQVPGTVSLSAIIFNQSEFLFPISIVTIHQTHRSMMC